LFDGGIMRGEVFVDFDEINLFNFQTGPLQSLACRVNGTDTHNIRFDSRVSPTDEASQGSYVARFNKLFARDNERRRAINDAGSVARRDETIFAESRTQFRQTFERRVGTQMVVRVEDCRSLARLDLNRHDLFSEDSRIMCALRFLL